MKQNLTELLLILDRSGSMSAIKTDMEGGLKSFLDKQKLEKGECLVTFYQFDNIVEKVFEAKSIKDVADIKIEPRNMTALFDAVGTAINQVGERLDKTPQSERPESVLVIIITDGQENASRDFTKDKIKEMVKLQEGTYGWKFIFLGSNFDAFAAGQDYGFRGATSVSCAATKKGISKTFDVLSRKMSAVRACSAADLSYTVAERAEVMDED